MASANLELVRSLYAIWGRGEFTSTEWAHPEIEWVIAEGPAPGSWRGLRGMADGWREFLNAWEEFRVEAEEFRELDDQRVLVLDHQAGRGRTSGVELGRMRTKGATLYHLRDGRVTKIVIYFDRERAFAELGLAPDG